MPAFFSVNYPMMILPSGYLYLCGYLPFTIAILSNNGPRRPVYIVIEIIIFPADENKPDRLRAPPSPVERPTVPKAEATSNNVCIRLMFSVKSNKVVEIIMIIVTIVVKRNALATISTDILLLKTVLSFLPRTADHNPPTIIANVGALFPPPVLAGA